MQKILLILFALLGNACSGHAPASEEKLKQEVNAIIYEKMLLAEAQKALSQHAFNCHEGTAYNQNLKGQFECTRSRGGLLYSCIHRVWFDVSAADYRIANITIHEPMCAGL
jgi:hypothetical protein